MVQDKDGLSVVGTSNNQLKQIQIHLSLLIYILVTCSFERGKGISCGMSALEPRLHKLRGMLRSWSDMRERMKTGWRLLLAVCHIVPCFWEG